MDQLALALPILKAGQVAALAQPSSPKQLARLASSPLAKALPHLVSAGHSLAVIVFCLGFDAEWVMNQVVAVGLPTPCDRPLRRFGSKTSWTSAEMQQLISLWPTNLYATRIAVKIGRSAASIRYKAKWLGLPTRDRSSLVGEMTVASTRAPRSREEWTNDEGQGLGDRHLRGQRFKPIAAHFGRTVGAVQTRVGHIGLDGRHGETLVDTFDLNGPLLPKFAKEGWKYLPCRQTPGRMTWVKTMKDNKPIPYDRIAPATRKLKSYKDLLQS